VLLNRMSQKIIILIIAGFSILNAQFSRPYEGPDDPASDIQAERDGFMNGNNVYLYFRNTTELSDCCNKGYWVSRWPADFSGSKMHDGIQVMLGGRVYLDPEGNPVTDLSEIQSRTDLDTLYYLESSYREGMDKNEAQTVEWGLYPVFGYFNPNSENPAMSNKPESWPSSWPGKDMTWDDNWNGRFGNGEFRADLETYFVANDAHDQEYLPTNPRWDGPHYYPRPGVFIDSSITIQQGFPWGGLGLRVEVRGFQWKNPEAADAIFFEYNIANISDYDIPEMYFGYYIDNAVGGEEYSFQTVTADDIAYFDLDLEMCYSWDLDGEMIGGGGVPGTMGVAFLESPGIPTDGIDNDQDGVIDERRDNEAVEFVSPMTGVASLADWNHFRGIDDPADTSTIHWHWDADEDHDWRDGLDVNNNNSYVYENGNGNWQLEPGELPGDDVGTDGSGPFDLDYPGPDANGTEGNHRPDLDPLLGSEPNFGFTDINESDMLGLTAFKYNFSWGDILGARNDENFFLWLMEEEPFFDEYQDEPKNFVENFASGKFTLIQGATERVSMSELHALENLHEQTAPPFSAPALFKLKEVVQKIYESDYQFAQPPLTPTLTATPADGKVILSWDDIAEKFTREPLLGDQNDFEGYKLYKSTDPFISDNRVITDGFGTPTLIKPLFQCDLVDERKGFTDFGYRNGAGYYLGDESGLQNYYIDEDVQNGRTYYYVLVAYDYGVDAVDVQVGPSENTYTIDLNRDETIFAISKNVAVVTPHQNAAGYQEPRVDNVEYNGAFGTNTIAPEVLVPQLLKNGNTYKVKFESDTILTRPGSTHGAIYRNTSISIYNTTHGDSLVYHENPLNFTGDNYVFFQNEQDFWDVQEGYEFDTSKELATEVFEGVLLRYRVPVLEAEYDQSQSGWLQGSAELTIDAPNVEERRFFAYDYDIIFTENADYTGRLTSDVRSSIFSDKGGNVTGSVLYQIPLPFEVVNRNITDSLGMPFHTEVVVWDVNKNDSLDILEDKFLVGHLYDEEDYRRFGAWAATSFVFHFNEIEEEALLPATGDVYHVRFLRGFTETDSVTFTVNVPTKVDKSTLNREMKDIAVVPNPYIVTNTMEAAVANWDKNQPRRLLFTNIPAECTIKIFTINGLLVDEIEVDNSILNRTSGFDNNSDANGTVHWDMLTKEGLEIAAGYYIYHVKSNVTGKEKLGKFAIIK